MTASKPLPGAVVATLIWAAASFGFTLYVSNFATYDLMYGPLGAVVVLLIWLSWNVNAVFYGGAFATELEIEWETRAVPPEPAALPETVVNLSERRQSRQ